MTPHLKQCGIKLKRKHVSSANGSAGLYARASATNQRVRSPDARRNARADNANSAMNPQSPMTVPRRNGSPAA